MDLELLDAARLRRRRGEKWRLYPEDVLPAWVADMDFAVAPAIRAYLAEALELSDVGYARFPTDHGVPQAFAQRMHELYGWSISPERVEVLSDVVQGLYIGLSVFSEPGDPVVTPVPVYPPFLAALRELERVPVALPFVPGRERYVPDFDQLEAKRPDTARVLMLCNPHNPTGRVMERDELLHLAELAERHDWIVLSDEIHADLCFDGHRHIPFASLAPEIEARTLTLTSASKAFNIAGLRCAVVHFGSAELQARFASLCPHLRGGLGIFGLEATRIAWQECGEWLDALRTYLASNRAYVGRFIRERWPEVACFEPEATYLAWLDCRKLALPGGAHSFFLRRARVGLSKGEAFGASGDGFVRLNFATSRKLLEQILERMDSALEQAQRG